MAGLGEAMYNWRLHAEIRSRIEAELGERTWSWLAQASGIPASTLSNQINRPRFSLDVVSRIADALGKDITYFVPVSSLANEE